MKEHDFLAQIAKSAADGQRELATLIRALIYERDADLLRRLDISDDRVFLEPTLFSFFRSKEPRASLSQLLLGSMLEENRPAEIPVISDDSGVIFLPNLGYLRTSFPRRPMRLTWRGSAGASSLAADGEPVGFIFQERAIIPGTDIELYRACPPGLEDLFRDPEGRPAAFDVAGIRRKKAGLVRQACAIIEEVYGGYFASILATIRGILVYNGARPYSFASLGAHGVAFLNAKPESSVVFFIEDIVHQCGHVIFSAATLSPSDVLAIDPSTPMSSISDLDDYHGGVYEALHGLFTQTNINRCLLLCRERGIFMGRDAYELDGRVSDDMKRFVTALHALGRRELYTDFGWDLYCFYRDSFRSLYAEQRDIIERFDTSNQPYIFDFEMFLEKNPLPEAS